MALSSEHERHTYATQEILRLLVSNHRETRVKGREGAPTLRDFYWDEKVCVCVCVCVVGGGPFPHGNSRVQFQAVATRESWQILMSNRKWDVDLLPNLNNLLMCRRVGCAAR